MGVQRGKTESKLDGVGRESSSILLDSREREDTRWLESWSISTCKSTEVVGEYQQILIQ